MNTPQVVGGVAALAALSLASVQAMNFVKYLLAKDWNGVVTNLAFFVVSFLLLLLAANSNYTEGVAIPGINTPLHFLDLGSLAIVALGIFGVGGQWYDRTRAKDNNQSAEVPSLVPQSPPNPPGGNA